MSRGAKRNTLGVRLQRRDVEPVNERKPADDTRYFPDAACQCWQCGEGGTGHINHELLIDKDWIDPLSGKRHDVLELAEMLASGRLRREQELSTPHITAAQKRQQ